MTEQTQNQNVSYAVLVTVTAERTQAECDRSLDELERLLDTAGGIAVARVIQPRISPDKATFIGSGKVEELHEFIRSDERIDLCVFDDELTPSQISNLGKALGIRVIDRTMLILDIFALHAATGEGKLQVEIACLRYTAPRLSGHGKDMSRLGGGIGTRGPGESKLEIDRRRLRARIALLQQQIAELEKNRSVRRAARERSELPSAAIIGYTNAGKSTLINYLTGAGILAEDKLFATLDPTTRVMKLPDGNDILLTDTVGFIDRLPTHLVKAFKSTLEELVYADILIMLTDFSEPESERARKRAVTQQMIADLGAGDKPLIEVYNKSDCKIDEGYLPVDAVCISAKTGEGVEDLLTRLQTLIAEGKKIARYFFAHSDGAKAADMYRFARVIECEYTDEGQIITAECDERARGMFKKYIIE